jgi:hypothetical protein
MRNLLLEKDEITLLGQVLAVPIHAFGLNDLLRTTNLTENRVKEISNLVETFAVNAEEKDVIIAISDVDIADLVKMYASSCEIIDPIEMPTITGYSWETSQRLLGKLRAELA